MSRLSIISTLSRVEVLLIFSLKNIFLGLDVHMTQEDSKVEKKNTEEETK